MVCELDWVGLGRRRLLRLAELGMIMGWVGRAGATIEAAKKNSFVSKNA